MGSVELALLLKYGVPLAVKLLADGKDEARVINAVTIAITNMEAGSGNSIPVLINATPEEADAIVNGLFGVLTGVLEAAQNLIKAFCGLFGAK